MKRRTYAEMLPEIRAENEAWRAEHLPRLRARDIKMQAERAAAAAIFERITQDCSTDEMALLGKFWGLAS